MDLDHIFFVWINERNEKDPSRQPVLDEDYLVLKYISLIILLFFTLLSTRLGIPSVLIGDK